MTVNRAEVTRQLQQAIARASARQDLFSIVVIRLSGLDTVREQPGYDAADRVVAVAQQRLSESLDSADWMGRLSDQEFLVVSHDRNSPSCAVKGSRRSLGRLREPIAIEAHDLNLMPHAGIALYPVDGSEPVELLRRALTAVRQAEEADTDPRYAFFDHVVGPRAAGDFALQQELRSAISKGLFTLHLQPKVALGSGELCGAEALTRAPARWQPAHPGDFLMLAERGRVMRPLGLGGA